MTFVGRNLETYEIVLFSVISFIIITCGVYHLLYLPQLKIIAVRIMPILYVSMAVDNVIMALGDVISSTSVVAYIAYAMHALHIPLFIVFMSELTYYLHKVRGVQYFFFEFNQETMETDRKIGYVMLTLIRILAGGLLVMTILTNFNLISAGEVMQTGGYIYLAQHVSSVYAWISLIPPIIMTIGCFIFSYMMARYGSVASWSSGITWRFLSICSLFYALGQIADVKNYFWTSNLGETFLLIGCVHTLKIVIADLKQSAQFSDFLRCSNIAFRSVQQHHESVDRKASPLRAPVHMAVRNVHKDHHDLEEPKDRQQSTATPHSMISYNSTSDGIGLIEVEDTTKEELYPTYGGVYALDTSADEIPLSPEGSGEEDSGEGPRRIISKELTTSTRIFTPAVPDAKHTTKLSVSSTLAEVEEKL